MSSLDKIKFLAGLDFLAITTKSQFFKLFFSHLKVSLAILLNRFLSTAKRCTFFEIASPKRGLDFLMGFAITCQ